MNETTNKIKTDPLRARLRRLGLVLAMVAAIGGGALLTGCGGGGDSHKITHQDIEEAKEKIENGEGPTKEQIEEAAAAVKEQFENGQGPGRKEMEEISEQGEKATEEAMESLENGEGVSQQKLDEAQKQAEEAEHQAEAFAEEVGE